MGVVNDSPRVLGNRYEVGDLLGRGGMAEVHLGRDARLGRVVAIKLLRTDLARDPTFQARFRREAQSAASLNHPAIVAVYDSGEEQVTEAGGAVVSLPYIVMELVEGRTLRDLLRDDSPLDVDLALEITAGALSALEYSHRGGIVHRDIKPANVMLTPNGDVKVMDFGIARALADTNSAMTQTQAVIGTAQYLSPEQARGEPVDIRSDLYSTGCLLFELITGRPPFVAESPVAVAYQHVREQPQLPSTFNAAVPPDVDRIVMHALSKDREARYQTAAEFREDLEAARAGRRVTVPPFAAATELIGAPTVAGTQFMPAAASSGVLLEPPGGMPGDDTATGTLSRREQRGAEERGPRKFGYVLLTLAVIAVLAIVGVLVYQLLNSPADATQVRVPSLANQTQAQATATLERVELRPRFSKEASDDVDEGKVISQSPEAETQVKPGSEVAVTISTGPDTVDVPDLKGKTQQDAIEALNAAGLVNGTVSTKDDPDVKSGLVISSKPAAGEAVKPGTAVSLVISSGDVEVPDVIGESRDDARDELRGLGFRVNDTEVETDDEEPGTVVTQSLPPGSKVARGSRITIEVATAPDETVTPTPSETPTPTVTATP
jgi:beta-lactam-binding protein with PASTA domain